jgi:spore maturation protein SpmA
MLNYVWSFLLLTGVLAGILFGRLGADGGIIDAALAASQKAVVSIALPLAGTMMLWLGILRVMEKAGLMTVVARALSPVLRLLFPDVPRDHPAMSAIVMNVAANLLGLGNAATPLGLKAMEHLQQINPNKQSASNAMCMFLALNTAGLTLVPMGAINYLSAGGVKDPFRIIGATLFSTLCATVVAILAAKLLQRWLVFRPIPDETSAENTVSNDVNKIVNNGAGNSVGTNVNNSTESVASTPAFRPSPIRIALLTLAAGVFIVGLLFEFIPRYRVLFLDVSGIEKVLTSSATKKKLALENAALIKKNNEASGTALSGQKESDVTWRKVINSLSTLAVPTIFVVVLLWGLARGVPVYEEAVEGAKEGFGIATRIMPFLVIMMSALAIFRESGALVLLEFILRPALDFVRMPVELLPLAIMRPLSGSGASGILADIINYPASSDFLRYTAAIMYGSTETTFYVLAVYFGSVGIRKIRHALAVGLIADVVGMFCAVTAGRLLFS